MLSRSVSAVATNPHIMTRLTRYISSFASSSKVLLSNDQCFVSLAFVFKNVTSSWSPVSPPTTPAMLPYGELCVEGFAYVSTGDFRRIGLAYLLRCIRPLTQRSRPSNRNRHAAHSDEVVHTDNILSYFRSIPRTSLGKRVPSFCS
ncbi:hypothetical protein KC364_g44 [Hortaea werneckii]|nr:hypothetical protein KC364_g44 [Hortaea werneckii]